MIPSFVLQRLYAAGSLQNADGGVQFRFVNGLLDIESVAILSLAIDGEAIPLEGVRLEVACDGAPAGQSGGAQPFPFPKNCAVTFSAPGRTLSKSRHEIGISFEARPYGNLEFTVADDIREEPPAVSAVPDAAGSADFTVVQEPPAPSGDVPAADPTDSQPGPVKPIREPRGQLPPPAVPAVQENLAVLYDNGIKLMSLSLTTYIDVQKQLLDVAIQRLKSEKIIADDAAQLARDVVADLTTSFTAVAQKSMGDLVAAGKSIIDSATRAAMPPEPPARAKRKRRVTKPVAPE